MLYVGQEGADRPPAIKQDKKWNLITVIREMIFLVQITGLVCKASF